MSAIVLLDTSVYLNILDVPGNNQDRDDVLAEFEIRIQDEDHFLLPMASIWETGNHIADLGNGGLRYTFGNRLVDDVTKAINGNTPYRPTHFPTREEFLAWLAEFPDHVKKNKSEKKIREGISLSDLSIIKEWEAAKARHNMSRVLIWSLDSDLTGYDTGAK
ncbi:MAG: hypothetical protein HGA96_13460 [Desulfobulbaceae bacterium]|nr:hypothetical protein [Desulfobulbaceae bacterium]